MTAQIRKAGPLLLIAVLAVLLFALKRCKNENAPDPQTNVTSKDKKKENSSINRDRGFDRRINFLEYSNHAKCRMQCRKISQSEVEDMMLNGKINYNKSDLQNNRCPRYAIEGKTADRQDVRIIFAQCNEKTEVVTVIDLDTDWQCSCPGDDKKYDNKN